MQCKACTAPAKWAVRYDDGPCSCRTQLCDQCYDEFVEHGKNNPSPKIWATTPIKPEVPDATTQ